MLAGVRMTVSFAIPPPCGIDGATMSCLTNEAAREITFTEATKIIAEEFEEL
jgi:hypothetical protein